MYVVWLCNANEPVDNCAQFTMFAQLSIQGYSTTFTVSCMSMHPAFAIAIAIVIIRLLALLLVVVWLHSGRPVAHWGIPVVYPVPIEYRVSQLDVQLHIWVSGCIMDVRGMVDHPCGTY